MATKKLTSYDMISEMHQDIKHIKEELIPGIHTELGILKVKNSVWSSMTGIVGGMLAVLTVKLWK